MEPKRSQMHQMSRNTSVEVAKEEARKVLAYQKLDISHITDEKVSVAAAAGELQNWAMLYINSLTALSAAIAATRALKNGAGVYLDPRVSVETAVAVAGAVQPGAMIFLPETVSEEVAVGVASALNKGAMLCLANEFRKKHELVKAITASLQVGAIFRVKPNMNKELASWAAYGLKSGAGVDLRSINQSQLIKAVLEALSKGVDVYKPTLNFDTSNAHEVNNAARIKKLIDSITSHNTASGAEHDYDEPVIESNAADAPMEVTPRVATAGVHHKYQKGPKCPDIPRILNASSKEQFVIPKDRFNNQLEFVYLNKLSNSDKSSTNSCKYNLNQKDVSFTLFSKNTAVIADEKVIFIFSGRGLNALLPNPEKGLRIILVIEDKQLDELKPYVTPGIDLLVINKLNSPTHGEYENLGRLNSRRLTAIFCALQFKKQGIKSVMMIDDNIESLLFNSEESTANFSMLDYFNNMAQELTKNNTVCSSVATASNITKAYSDNSLGCKLFMFDIDKINEKFGADINNVFYLAYPSKSNHFWGEDYFLQLMLDVTFAGESKGFCVLDHEIFALQRSTLNRNSCRAVVNKANDLVDVTWYQLFDNTDTDMCLQWLDNTFASGNKTAYQSLIVIIKDNISQYQKSLDRVKGANLMLEHAKANRLKYEEPGEIQPIDESGFLTEFSKQITLFLTQLKENSLSNKLRPYQIRVLQEIGQNIERGLKKGQINLAAGTGKTYVQAYIAMIALLTGTKRPVMIVAPNMLLVEQAYKDFISVFNTLVKELDLPLTTSQIIKIDSSEQSVGVPALDINDFLAGLPCVFITCNASYKKLIAHTALWQKLEPCLFLQDENHLCSKDELPVLENGLVVGLSATPPKDADNKYLKDGGFNIKYNRAEAVADKFNAPLVHRKFNCDYSFENVKEIISKIPALLNNLTTPAGQQFKNCKGIIYVPNDNHNESYSCSNDLKKILEEEGIKCFEINTKNTDYKKQLNEYKKYKNEPSTAKILIFKGMGRVGFSDNDVEWAIDLQNGTTNPQEVYQKACRTTRVNGTKCGTYISCANSDTSLLFPDGNSYDEQVLELCTDEYKTILEKTNGEINIAGLAAQASSNTSSGEPGPKRARGDDGKPRREDQEDLSDNSKPRKTPIRIKETAQTEEPTPKVRAGVQMLGANPHTMFGRQDNGKQPMENGAEYTAKTKTNKRSSNG